MSDRLESKSRVTIHRETKPSKKRVSFASITVFWAAEARDRSKREKKEKEARDRSKRQKQETRKRRRKESQQREAQ